MLFLERIIGLAIQVHRELGSAEREKKAVENTAWEKKARKNAGKS